MNLKYGWRGAMCRGWWLALLLGAALGMARAAEPAPGIYVSEGGWGTLEIKPSVGGLPFALLAVGPNGHNCDLSGTIRGGRAALSDEGAAPVCTVLFQPGAAALQVDVLDAEPCHSYCGARAWFTGAYLPLSPRCTAEARKSSQQRFMALYRSKAYARALAELMPILGECRRTLHWIDAGSLRNDVAITQYHLGQLDDCRRTLAPVLADATDNEDTLRDRLPPADFESFLPIAKAAWFNARLCAAQGR